MDLLAELRTRTLIFDGAMGTQLIAAGYRPTESPESWNSSAPDVVAGIHRAYLAAGFSTGAKGEITVVIDSGEPTGVEYETDERARAAAAELRLAGLSRRDAAAALAVCLGVRRNEAKRLVEEVEEASPEA